MVKVIFVITIFIIRASCWFFEPMDMYVGLDALFQKKLRYEHHLINYEESLSYKLTPTGLQLKHITVVYPRSRVAYFSGGGQFPSNTTGIIKHSHSK